MGKAQSKSVNITTEPSMEIQEGTGELKKLDDSHFKETDSSDKENKVVNDAAENEKNEIAKVEAVIPEETPAAPAPAPETEDNKVEAPSTDDKATEEIKEATPEPDSAAKPKKEKVKKKWSFRSISFGKKDKQKPSKKDKKNEENKAVAESAEEKLEEDVEGKPVETVDEKPQETVTKTSEAVETRPLEPVVESVAEVVKDEVKPKEEVKPEVAPAIVPEPVTVVPEPVRAKTPEPVIAPSQEKTIEETVVESFKPSEPEPTTPASTPVEEKPTEIPEPVAQPIVEDPPAIPATPPPSQFSVFAESMNTATTEESLPTPAEVVEVAAEMNGEEIDVEPVAAEMVEKVLEEAVDHVEAEIKEKADDDLPPPPADEVIETTPATEVVVEVTQNGVGEHADEPVKLENGVHNGDVINESEPIVGELKKEDKVSDKIAQDSALAPEIITE